VQSWSSLILELNHLVGYRISRESVCHECTSLIYCNFVGKEVFDIGMRNMKKMKMLWFKWTRLIGSRLFGRTTGDSVG